jgi:hypothetical protein
LCCGSDILPPGGRHNPVRAGLKMKTGHPVIVVFVVVVKAALIVEDEIDVLIFSLAAFIRRTEIMK